MITEERNPRTLEIDRLPTLEILQLMNEEDQRVAAAVAQSLPQIAAAVDLVAERLAQGGRLIYVGAGTSGRLGILDAVECVPTFGTSPEMVQGLIAGGLDAIVHSIEGAEDDGEMGREELERLHPKPQDAICGIAASGRTPYVLGAIAAARKVGSATIGIACNDPSPLLQAVECPIPLLVGPEVITGSTRLKSGTAQKMALNMLSTAAMIRLGKVYGNLMVDVKVTNAKLAHRARQIVQQAASVDENAAAALLDQAQGSAKVAIVMARRGVSADEAEHLLQASGGRLRDIIG